jgi:putative hydrolase of the HAD superfamily
MDRVDITGWFDRVVVSHDLDAPKEQQIFWERLQELHPFDPKHTLFIDDTEAVLDAAQQYGIRHLLTLLQPDSSQQKRIDTRFPGIHHFDEIMPEALP